MEGLVKDFVDKDGGGEWGRVGLGEEIMGNMFVVGHRDSDKMSV